VRQGSGIRRSEPGPLPSGGDRDGRLGLRGAVVLHPRLFHNRPHPAPQTVAPTPEAADPVGGSAAYATWLETNIELVDRLARVTAQRARLSPSETDDFVSDVHLKLIADDFAVLRSFKGRSRLTTFLLTVLQRVAIDFRNARWGRWRPSAEASRLGTSALRLEELVYRDGLSFDEACGRLNTEGHSTSRDQLYEMLGRLPVRPRPDRTAAPTHLDGPIDPETPESQAAASEAAARAVRLQTALRRICDALAGPDRLALRLRFQSGLTLAAIARLLQIDEKLMYRRFEHALAEVRRALEAEGLTVDDALAGVHGVDLDSVLPAPTQAASGARVSESPARRMTR
jgi:RNA polymerase sigma factor (sigma-70 family)